MKKLSTVLDSIISALVKEQTVIDKFNLRVSPCSVASTVMLRSISSSVSNVAIIAMSPHKAAMRNWFCLLEVTVVLFCGVNILGFAMGWS